MAAPDVTVIIVNYNTRELLQRCLAALSEASAGVTLQIVVVDNGSRDGSADFIRAELADRCEIVVNEVNVGFGRANNQAVGRARGRYVLLLNTDAFVAPQGVAKTVRFLDGHPSCGVLGVRLEGQDGGLQPSCRYFPTPWNEFLLQTGLARFFPGTRTIDDMRWDHATPRACDWVPGCYYLVRKSVVDQVGLFDPRFFLYYEEVDHCYAVKEAGWQVMYFPDTTVVHLGGESAQTESTLDPRSRQVSALAIESALLYHRKRHGRRGLLLKTLLTMLADAIVAAKRPMRRPRPAAPLWQESRMTLDLLRRTRFGLRPTR